MSKDPSTRVGAIVVGPDNEVRSMGFNGFPRGIADTPERLMDRELKYRLVVHAERNALLNAARIGTSVRGCTLYISAMDAASGRIWGGPPCTACSIEVIQAGIRRIITRPMIHAPERWQADLIFARSLLLEAGIEYVEVT